MFFALFQEVISDDEDSGDTRSFLCFLSATIVSFGHLLVVTGWRQTQKTSMDLAIKMRIWLSG
jgi:hypothetical protein